MSIASKCLGIALITGAAATAAVARERVVRIGVLMPISGPASYFGVQDKEGFDLALDQLGKAPPINGYRLQLQVEDSACSPLQATNAAKRVLEQFKPALVIGEECSDASLAIAPILEQAQVPLLNAGSVTMKLTESGYKYVFRIFPNAEQQSLPLAKVAYQTLKARTAVVLYEKTNAGNDNADGFEKLFAGMGGKVLARIDFGRDVNDFTAIATRIASLGRVDVLPWGFDQKAGPPAEGYVRIVQFDPTEQRPMVQNFVAAFRARYGADRTPSHINAHAYDAIMLAAEAVRRGATDAASMRDQLARMKDIEVTTGRISFDAKGQNSDLSVVHFVETQKDLSWRSLAW